MLLGLEKDEPNNDHCTAEFRIFMIKLKKLNHGRVHVNIFQYCFTFPATLHLASSSGNARSQQSGDHPREMFTTRALSPTT